MQADQVIGIVCHIEANRPKGPRYRLEQSEAERQSAANLVILCPLHHQVIDSDPGSYTVARLKEIKASHESGDGSSEISEEQANFVISKIDVNTTIEVNVKSVNQSGGQNAQIIYNLAPIPSPASPLTSLEITWRKEPKGGIQEAQTKYYNFYVIIRNVGKNIVRDWAITLDFPAMFVGGGSYMIEVNPLHSGYRRFRLESKHRNDLLLYPGDPVDFSIEYWMRNDANTEREMAKPIRISASCDGFHDTLEVVMTELSQP